MLIATWNINSVRIRLQIIEGWIQERKPDIVLLQEIKCENDSFPKSFFENLGYVCQINGEKGKNGVAILIKKSCHLGSYSVSNFDFNKSSQARVIELNFDNRLYILSLYAPNGNPITDKTKFCLKNLWYKNLFKHTRNLFNNESDIILGGDFNVLEGENDVLDIKNWKNDALGCDETIYNFGNAYTLVCQNLKKSILFNGNHEVDNSNFDNYLSKFGYKFKNTNQEIGGYLIQKNKKIALIMDIGPSPEKKFSRDYQSGTLSFEIISNDNKIISNSGYFQNYKHKLNELSKSTATHSTLILDNTSSCKLRKVGNKSSTIEQGLKIMNKSAIFSKSYWNVIASHNGYLKKYGIIRERKIEFFPDQNKFIGNDILIKKKKYKSTNFEIRFHLYPSSKIMKTQDNKSIFIEIAKEGWKFTCDNHEINLETGLYFGKKGSYIENQNIFISGMTNNQNQNIKWELIKIS